MPYYAHSRAGEPPESWQTVEDHLGSVAGIAQQYAQTLGFGAWSELTGRWHDLGKFSTEFQARIGADLSASTETRPGKVDHSTAGAKHAVNTLGDLGLPIAYAIAGHHAGLPNWYDDTYSHLKGRLERAIPDWSAAPQEISTAPALTPDSFPFKPDAQNLGIQVFLFIRMLFSCLVDADFADTEAFIDPARSASRGNSWTLAEIKARIDAHIQHLAQESAADPHGNPIVRRARLDVLAACRAAANREPGLFSLTVPTGGGKTLSSVAFALDHALKHGLRRVIYVIPYTSIIEQNAEVFRSAVGEIKGQSPVLEHHSNFEPAGEDQWSRLAAENWDAPLVVTTNVQFFESIFSHRAGRSRRVHNIAESVVVLDEAQMLPPRLLRPTLRVLDELSATYRSSIVFCTATQPAVDRRPDFPDGLSGIREIIPDVAGMFGVLKRNRVENCGAIDDAELADEISRQQQILVVVNTRAHARQLYETVAARSVEGLYHLSALMYPRHRQEVIQTVRDRLGAGLPVRLVSTQLVEAGVDIDFPVVYRAVSGIDSVAQAAGRCNREGRIDGGGQVCVFVPSDGSVPRQFRQAVATAQEVMTNHSDPLSPQAVEAFFRGYYWRLSAADGQDKAQILPKLRPENAARFHIPFRDISEAYRLINADMESIIVLRDNRHRDYKPVHEMLEDLRYAISGRQLLRRLQRYTVQVYEHSFRRFHIEGALDEIRPGVFVLSNARAYHDTLGLVEQNPGVKDPGTLML